MAETDINLSIGLNTKDAEKEAEQLQKEIEKIFDSRSGAESAALTNLELQMKKNYDTAQQLREQLHKLSETDALPRTKEFEEVSRQHEELMSQYQELKAQRAELASSEMVHPKQISDLNDQLESIHQRMEELRTMREDLVNEGKAFIPVEETEEYQNIADKLDLVNDKLKQQIIRHDEMTAAEVRNYEKIQDAAMRAEEAEARRQAQSEVSAANAEARQYRQGFTAATSSVMGLNRAIRGVGRLIPGVKTTAITAVGSVATGVLRLAKLTKEQLANAIVSVKTAVVNLLKFLATNPIVLAIVTALGVLIYSLVKVKKMMDKIKGVAVELGKAVLSFLKSLPQKILQLTKLILRMSVAVERTFFTLISKLAQKLTSLKGIVKENLDLMVKWNKGVNSVNVAMSNLTSSLAYVKASLATAFAPILTTIEPLLTSMMNKIGDITTSIGIFIAQLTGQTKFQRAIRYQRDYAKSLAETNNQLASFDKLNNITTGGDNDPEKTGIQFEEIDVEPLNLHVLEDLFDKASEMAKKFSDAINGIDWDKIQQGAEDAALGVSNFVNGFMEGNVGASLGTALGNLFNTVQAFFDGLFDEQTGINFTKLGTKIGTFFGNAIGTINWKKVGKTLWKGFRAALQTLRGILSTNTGKKLGRAFSDFLTGALGTANLEWNEIDATLQGVIDNIVEFLNEIITPQNFELIGTTFGNVVNSICTGASKFAKDAHWSEWGTAIETAINNFFKTWNPEWTAEAVSAWVLGLEDMLSQAINGIDWDMVSDKIVTFLANIDWKSIGEKAKQISQALREGLQKVWTELKEQGVVDDIISVVVDLFNEYEQWMKFFKQIKKEIFWSAFRDWWWGGDAINNENTNVVGGSAISYGQKTEPYSGVRYFTKEEMWELQHPGQKYSAQTAVDETLKETKETNEILTDTEKFLMRIWEEIGSDQFKSLTGVTVLNGNFGNLSKDERNALYSLLKRKGYASGTVIPPTASEFLAKVGDNNREAEVISPLSTIEQALRNVLSEQNINITFDVQGDPDRIFNVVQRQARVYNKRTGSPAFAGGR